ncbi:2-C-methyl-D-erythritol 2,4-cyclodiphosphate synthase [Vibrio maritimus]|uniref:2-C-methyl-D-erythritol 2,4-cyclodiphosphate synthase n=2 Tax=Vibrio TaxID=662 RepID=A0A090SPS7_9VIBR|nr:2-C-methyl-D-erythritol 2,4-cyclodiphosphate synthase [Vibrio maritimus]
MAPHIESMCQVIAQDLDTDIGNVNVKATTTERLGFTGRKEGIATEAVVLINKVTS